MQKKLFRSLLLLFFAAMSAAMLLSAPAALALASDALTLWFSRMIPALLPFMILSSLLLLLGLSDSFAALFSPLLRPLLRLSDSCLYCVAVGFLCGFPVGAKVCAQSLLSGKISRREASLLLAFCNNIGPVYLTGYVLQLFPLPCPWVAVAGLYGTALLYGCLLRYSVFRDIPFSRPKALSAAAVPDAAPDAPSSPALRRTAANLLSGLHSAVLSSLSSIATLGGYMIFCNMLNLLPDLLLSGRPALAVLLSPLLEITGGLARLPASEAFWAYTLLPFGGLSCLAQTYGCIRDTGLSLTDYAFHKLIQTVLAAAWFGLWLG
ncbi:MAG: hypothetical protein Q4C65_00555 [Eubacteriales bacterium]|nr:hypothetical protein [Eubacteriales bacterium]